MLQKAKKYREANKELIKKSKSRPYECICGSTIQIDGKSDHFKSKKHINYINKQTN